MNSDPLAARTAGASGNVTSFASRSPNGSQISEGMNVKSARIEDHDLVAIVEVLAQLQRGGHPREARADDDDALGGHELRS